VKEKKARKCVTEVPTKYECDGGETVWSKVVETGERGRKKNEKETGQDFIPAESRGWRGKDSS